MIDQVEKIRIAVKRHKDNDDIEAMSALVYILSDMAILLSKTGGASNYTLVQAQDGEGWFEVADGTKDYCIGYAEAYGHTAKVVCGDFVVWPEDEWGETISGKRFP